MRCPLVPTLVPLLLTGCVAVSSPGNYSVSYKGVGAFTETAEFNKAAEAAYESESQSLSKAKVFLDSIPPELSVKDSTVSAAEGSGATLVGSVDVSAIYKVPSEDAEVLPALERASSSADADLAFCPRGQKPADHIWRCYLVRTAAKP